MAKNELEIILKARNEAERELAKLEKQLDNITKETKKTASAGRRSAQTLKKNWLAITAAVYGTVQAMRAAGIALNKFAAYEKGLTNIKVLMGENADQIRFFDEAISDLSIHFGVATDQLLKSAFDIQSAVGNTTRSLDILNASTRLAVAGGSDLSSTSSGLVTLMESYGDKLKGAADGADLLFQAQVRARATIGELSQVSGSFLPLASKLGISAEDSFAAFSKMTVALGNVNESGTAMNGVLNGLLKPTDELKVKVKEWFGVSVQQAVQQGKFLDILEKLGTVEEEELGRMMPRLRGLKGLLAVSQDIAGARKIAIDLANRENVTEKALAEQMTTTKVQIDRLRESWQELIRIIGEFVADSGLINFLSLVIEKMKNIVDFVPSVAEAIGTMMGGGAPGGEGSTTEGTDARMNAIMLMREQGMTLDEIRSKIQETTNAEVQAAMQTQEIERQKLATKKASAAEQVKIAKKITDEEIKLRMKSAASYMTASAGVLGQLAQFYTQAQGDTKKHAGIIKAIRIGEAIMNTAAGITNAFATSGNIYAGIAMAALVATMGAIQIATIASQNFAQGTDNVPANLSAGEMVVPRKFSDAIRAGDLALSGPGSAGSTQSINIEINSPSFNNEDDMESLVEEISNSIARETERL